VLAAGLAAAGCAAAGVPWWRGLLGVGLAALVTAALVRRAVRRAGGVTGDVMGACIETSLACLLVAAS
jgi:adenosylcobinamide-GDP ribazoletransferase